MAADPSLSASPSFSPSSAPSSAPLSTPPFPSPAHGTSGSLPGPPGNPLQEKLLAELRDIETPLVPDVWPPAIGWWGLAVIAGITAWLIYRALASRRARTAYRREAASTLEEIYADFVRDQDPRRYARQAAEVTRRVAIQKVGRERASRPTGTDFGSLLNTLSASPLSSECARMLGEAAYRPDANLDFDVEQLQLELIDWLECLNRDVHA